MDAEREQLKELMAAPPAEFTAVRTRLVREGARELAKVRKPPLKLWAANRAMAARRDAVERLAAVTRHLQELERSIAHGQKGAGAELRSAAADQRRELDVLESEARSQLTAIHVSPSAAVEARDIIRTAALAGAELWSDLAEGVLTHPPDEPGDAVFGVAEAELPRPRVVDAKRQEERFKRLAEAAAVLRAEAVRLRQEAERLQDEAHQMKRRADSAEARASEAESKL